MSVQPRAFPWRLTVVLFTAAAAFTAAHLARRPRRSRPTTPARRPGHAPVEPARVEATVEDLPWVGDEV